MSFNKTKRPPLVLIILDGWGLAPPGPYNSITRAKTPCFDYLWENYPHTKLYAHGSYVGLPKGQVGNSEAGHLNIGAGRIVIQDAVYISEAIKDGTFFKNPAFLEALQHVKQHNSTLHLLGILSGNQCPHMSPDHVVALSRLAQSHKIKALLHFFTDGRDAPPQAALGLWLRLKKKNLPLKTCLPASVAGRLYLDRKKKWARTGKIYNALVLGQSECQAADLEEAVKLAYERGETDEFISPTLIRNKKVSAKDTVSDGDSIIFYNLRSDRARQLTKPFVQEEFEELNQGAFQRTKILRHIKFVAMTDFGPDLGPVLTAFPSRDIKQTLPMVLGEHYQQLYISEMEKYAHITYFVNGGFEKPVAGEDRILVRSKDVDSYDQVPAMATREITEVLVESLRHKLYNFVCVNFCNADMLGHTGNITAAIAGCAAVDRCLAKILKVVKEQQGELLITSDHGNAENMGETISNGNSRSLMDTMHEVNPVPLIIYTRRQIKLKGGEGEKTAAKKAALGPQPAGKLGDIVPTLLDLVGIKQPKEMTGESLIISN